MNSIISDENTFHTVGELRDYLNQLDDAQVHRMYPFAGASWQVIEYTTTLQDGSQVRDLVIKTNGEL